jgi:AraC-like DNA-binding protein
MIDKVRSAVLDNRRITIRELSDELGLSFGSVQSILTEDLGKNRVSAKFVRALQLPEICCSVLIKTQTS